MKRSIRALAWATTLLVMACGGSESSDGPTDTGGIDGSFDGSGVDTSAPADVGLDTKTDATAADTTADSTAETSADSIAEASPDTAADAVVDAPSGLTITVTPTIFEDCMPIVASDPVSITGDVTVRNDTGASVGPITATFGTVRTPGGAAFGTYKLKSLSIPAIAHGASSSAKFQKEPSTFSPASACASIKCGSSVEVELTFFGTGLPTAGLAVKSTAVTCSCAL